MHLFLGGEDGEYPVFLYQWRMDISRCGIYLEECQEGTGNLQGRSKWLESPPAALAGCVVIRDVYTCFRFGRDHEIF